VFDHLYASGDTLSSRSYLDHGSELRIRVGAGEGNRTLMTSSEGVPRMAVTGADLRVWLSGSDRD
jgi:hypothetical protein